MADKWRKFLLITDILPPPSRPPIYWKKSRMKLWTIDWPIARTTQNSSKSTKTMPKMKKIYISHQNNNVKSEEKPKHQKSY